jgi:hypothetical protein
MKNEAAPGNGKQILHVCWFSGTEFISLNEVRESLNSTPPTRIKTSELRKGGGLVEYDPLVEPSDEGAADSFSLKYDNPGNFESGEDAGGDLGTATYRRVDGKWECSWRFADEGLKSVKPKCNLLDPLEARGSEWTARTVRDHAFRAMILGADGNACAITGETCIYVLDAAHVLEVKHKGLDSIDNGLILRKDLHALFDASLLTISPDGEIKADERLGEQYQQLVEKFPVLRNQTLKRIRENLAARNARQR